MLAIPLYILIFGSISLLALGGLPFISDKFVFWHKKIAQDSLVKSEEVRLETKKVQLLYIFSPVILGLLAWVFFNKILGVVLAAILSLLIPNLVLNIMLAKRQKRFIQQLIDGLMILSSSLKGGLSFIQSLEVLCEEMPAPIAEEFSLVLREIKMGVTVDEALNRLTKRMPSEELELFVSSVLVARETGGDLTKVFSRLISTIRERIRLKETIATYTMQGKIQGVIMSVLPVVFVLWVQRFNPHHFDEMWQTELGRMLLVGAVFLELIALVLIKKFSTIRL